MLDPHGGQECPPHTISHTLNPQKFLENKSGNHRKNEEQPDPVHFVPGNPERDIALRIIDRNRLDRTIVRQRRLSRGEYSLPEMVAPTLGRNPRQLRRDADCLRVTLWPPGRQSSPSYGAFLAGHQSPDDFIVGRNMHGRRARRNLRRQLDRDRYRAPLACLRAPSTETACWSESPSIPDSDPVARSAA